VPKNNAGATRRESIVPGLLNIQDALVFVVTEVIRQQPDRRVEIEHLSQCNGE
jgi:hypothetical protein